MSLTSAQVVTLAELLGETPDSTQSALDGLPRIYDAGEVTAIEAALVADLTTFAAVKNKHLRVGGGRDGVDLDYERDRAALRARNRKRLGLPEYAAGEHPEGAAYFVTQRGPGW